MSSSPAADGGSDTLAPGADAYDAARAVLQWRLARRALALALACPRELGGIVLHGRHGPARDALLAELARRGPVRRIPSDADETALVGGLDTSATLAHGRRVLRAGLLDAPPGETLLVGGAERLGGVVTTCLCAWLEDDAASGSAARPADAPPARAPLVALDESLERSGLVESALGERLALHVDVPELALAELVRVVAEPHLGDSEPPSLRDAANAPHRHGTRAAPSDATGSDTTGASAPDTSSLNAVTLADDTLHGLVHLAAHLGIGSLRSAVFACRVARANAWLDDRDAVTDADAALAAQLVLAPRARRLPDVDEPVAMESEPPGTVFEDSPPEPSEERPPKAPSDETDAAEPPEPKAPDADAPVSPHDANVEQDDDPLASEPLAERLVEAVAAALPRHLLDELAAGRAPRAAATGRDARASAAAERGGRPIGTHRPRGGSGRRPNLVATLKAAIPHQRLRAREAGDEPSDARPRLRVRRDDFRVTRYRRPTRTTTLFVVDASGSAAMHRLAEAKGAVESLLAECYVRRDRVALITFRGDDATLDLSPTRSLVRARRALIGLPGGGGTPLAAGLELAAEQLERLVRDGESPVGVIMTDGRANIARDGTPSRPEAHADAERAARRLAATGARLLFVDTGPRPRPVPQRIAALMGARYLPLPQLDTTMLSAAGRAR